MKDNPAIAQIAQEYWPDYSTHPEKAIQSRSPAYWADEIKREC
jgi:hypothetical protein